MDKHPASVPGKKKKIGHNIQETASITGFVFFNFEGSRMAIFRH